MLQQLYVIGDSCKQIHTCVKQKCGYFEHKLWHFNSFFYYRHL